MTHISAFLHPTSLRLPHTTYTKTSLTCARPPLTACAPLPSPTPLPTAPPSTSQVTFTSLNNNSFILKHRSATLLIDPWLNDDLIFLNPSFFRSSKPQPPPTSPSYADLDLSTVDAILLTQELADHAHPPTLTRLPRHIPILAPTKAIPLLRSLKYQTVIEMTYEQTVTPLPHIPHLRITACKGSIVGPPWSDPQLAYIFTFDADSQHPLSVYHEPHGVHDETFLAAYKGKLDAVIAPVVSTTLPVLANYSLVNGVPEAVRLCNLVRPRACLTFDNSGGEQSGFLTGFLSKAGGLDQFKSAVAELPQLRDMQIIPAGPLMHPVVIAAHPATTPVSHN